MKRADLHTLMQKPGSLTLHNPNKIVAKITIKKVLGRDVIGFDYETGVRLQEAYTKAGKELGGFIRKNAK